MAKLSSGDIAELTWFFCDAHGEMAGPLVLPLEPRVGDGGGKNDYEPSGQQLHAVQRARATALVLERLERTQVVALQRLYGPHPPQARHPAFGIDAALVLYLDCVLARAASQKRSGVEVLERALRKKTRDAAFERLVRSKAKAVREIAERLFLQVRAKLREEGRALLRAHDEGRL